MKVKTKFLRGLIGLALLAVLFVPTIASADQFTYTLNLGNTSSPGISGFPAPFGTVTVDRTSDTVATITFEGTTTSGFTYKFGDGSTVALNVNGSFDYALVSDTMFKEWAKNPPVQVDGWGQFQLAIDNITQGGASVASVSEVKLSLTATGTTKWSTAADVLATNSDGHHVAAHVYVFDKDEINTATGYAADGVVPVPEPASVAIAGLGALGLLAYSLRRRKA